MYKVDKIERIEEVTLFDGVYDGVWGGYLVVVVHDGTTYHIHTHVGVRGINIPCKVTVLNGVATVE